MTLAVLVILFKPVVILDLKDFLIIWLSNLLTLGVADEDYARNPSGALSYISPFLLAITMV
jgi:hypothetical protein